jgi:tetratricopeptide (TPR) repeat protein
MHERDLSRRQLFLKSAKPPPIGTEITISLTLPSGTTIELQGRVARHVPAGSPDGRGPGVDLLLSPLPQSTLLLIENALASAGIKVASKAPAPAPTPAPPAPSAPFEADEPVEESAAAAAEFDLVQALEAELAALRAMNPFQVLGVGYEASDAQVRMAFNDLTKKYHPDRFARFESEQARALAGEIFILVRDAYRKIGEAGPRAITRAAVQGGTATRGSGGRSATPPVGVPRVPRISTPPGPVSGSGPGPASAAAAPASAQPQAHPLARAAAAPGAAARALPLQAPPEAGPGGGPPLDPQKVLSFRNTGPQPAMRPPAAAAPAGAAARAPAAGLDADDLFADVSPPAGAFEPGAPPDAPIDLAASPLVARAEALLDAGRYEEAYLAYDAAARSHPTDRAARVGRELARGFQRLVEGDRINAAQCFEAALEIEPMNERAARELAAMRRAATDARKGLLGKLLGKKT